MVGKIQLKLQKAAFSSFRLGAPQLIILHYSHLSSWTSKFNRGNLVLDQRWPKSYLFIRHQFRRQTFRLAFRVKRCQDLICGNFNVGNQQLCRLFPCWWKPKFDRIWKFWHSKGEITRCFRLIRFCKVGQTRSVPHILYKNTLSRESSINRVLLCLRPAKLFFSLSHLF